MQTNRVVLTWSTRGSRSRATASGRASERMCAAAVAPPGARGRAVIEAPPLRPERRRRGAERQSDQQARAPLPPSCLPLAPEQNVPQRYGRRAAPAGGLPSRSPVKGVPAVGTKVPGDWSFVPRFDCPEPVHRRGREADRSRCQRARRPSTQGIGLASVWHLAHPAFTLPACADAVGVTAH